MTLQPSSKSGVHLLMDAPKWKPGALYETNPDSSRCDVSFIFIKPYYADTKTRGGLEYLYMSSDDVFCFCSHHQGAVRYGIFLRSRDASLWAISWPYSPCLSEVDLSLYAV